MTENYTLIEGDVDMNVQRLTCARTGHKLKATRGENQQWTYVCDECQIYWMKNRIS